MAGTLAALMFPTVLALLPLGFPVAFTVLGVAIIYAVLGSLAGPFDLHLLSALPLRLQNLMDNDILQAIPLFIYVGAVMERTHLARDLLGSLGALAGRRPAGLAFASLAVGLLMAPTTGAIGATVVALGLLALPPMLAAGYDRRFATGITTAVGTLGVVLPPSIILILITDQMRIAQSAAQQVLLQTSIPTFLMRKLYLGMVVPVGLVVVGYVAIVLWRAVRRPLSVPAYAYPLSVPRALRNVVPPVAIFALTLYAILSGRVYTVEAAGAAAIGITLYALLRRELTARTLREVVSLVTRITGALFLLIIGAGTFSLVFRGFGGDVLARQAITTWFGSPEAAVPAVFATLLVFGFFLDAIEIVFLVVPVAIPPLIVLGGDPMWLGVLVGLTLQTSFLLPPAGFALFFMDQVRRNIGAEDITMPTIYRGIVPFALVQVAVLVAVIIVPVLATWLPGAT